MISHARAQALISARLDEALPAADAQALQSHLLGCATCRRFAEQTDALGRGLRALPHLPASPNVSRQVMEAVNAGRSPWRVLSFGMRLASGPALATVGSLVLVAALAFTVVLALNPPGGGDGEAPTAVDAPLAQQPRAETATAVATATATVPATATATPTATIAATTPTPRIAIAGVTETAPVAPPAPRRAAEDAVETPSPTAVRPTPRPRVNVTVTRTPTPAGDAATVAESATAVPAAPAPAAVPTLASLTPVAAAQPGGRDDLAPAAPPSTPEPTAPVFPEPTPEPPTATPVPTAPPPTATAAPTGTPAPPAVPVPTDVPTATATPPPAATATVTATAVPSETPPSIVVVAPTVPAVAPSPIPPATAIPEATSTPVPIVPATSVPTAAAIEVDGDGVTAIPIEPVSPTIVPVVPQDGGVVGGPAPAPPTAPVPAAPEPTAPLPVDDGPGAAPIGAAATPVAASDAFGDDPSVEAAPADGEQLPVESGAGDGATIPVEVDPAAEAPRGGGAVSTVAPAETGVVGGPASAADEGETPNGAAGIGPTAGTTPAPISDPAAGSDGESGALATIAPAPEAAPAAIRPARARDRRATREAAAATATVAPAAGDPVAAEAAPVAVLPTRTLGGGDAFTPIGVVAMEDGDGVTVLDPSGGTVALAEAASPVWSPLGAVLLVTMPNPVTGLPSIAFWERGTAGPGPLPESLADEGRYRDIPAGWSSSIAYYQRVYEDGSGRVELRADDILTDAGFETVWSGAAGDVGAFGDGVSAARVSPDGSRIAFVADGRLHVAATADPGRTAVAIDGEVVGFDWSPASDRLAVSDGEALTIYGAAGGLLESGSGGAGGVGAPVWREDGIYVPRLDGSGELLLVSS